MSDPVLARLQADRDGIIERLRTLVSAPSVSTDPAYADGMAAARAILCGRLAAAGFQGVREIDAGGHPAVYAEWLGAPQAPTFIVYGHYDVQPPDPLDLWHSEPFAPEIRDARLYGRGVSDDKGPVSIAIETLSAFLAVEGRLPVNVRLLIEGEEEIGSATLGDILDSHRDLFQADAVISADGARWRADLASINVGSRGSFRCEVALRTASKDLHSGRFGGGVRNALHEMAALLASLHDTDGRITIEGYADDATPLAPEERERMAEIPFDEAAFFSGIGADSHGEPGHTALERLWHRPTVEINGMWGGYQGKGSKTVTPCEAFAKITTRLGPGQDPARARSLLEGHLRQHSPDGVELTLDLRDRGTAAYTVPANHPLLLTAEEALETALAQPPVRVRMGGTLPLSDIVRDALGLDTVTMSFSTADEDFHAPNEFFRLSAIDDGVVAWVDFLRRLGTQTPDLYAPFKASR
ncbi:dipeptidase [Stappia sp. ES.058]|uniref:dipeptidase n=1 Tax=Stappia sp. ES.058 TaxID=1881061 RepID=UPI00087B6823|nr:dipeptidase [Stappia sp. ES.058]SDU03956.1 Acetylornithine deacetylase/Succinyl-diaminopimelate desuccinylase [Stappia sp. ES.058]